MPTCCKEPLQSVAGNLRPLLRLAVWFELSPALLSPYFHLFFFLPFLPFKVKNWRRHSSTRVIFVHFFFKRRNWFPFELLRGTFKKKKRRSSFLPLLLYISFSRALCLVLCATAFFLLCCLMGNLLGMTTPPPPKPVAAAVSSAAIFSKLFIMLCFFPPPPPRSRLFLTSF